MTLTEFLRAQLDADERVAQAAAPGGWVYQDVEGVGGGRICDLTVEILNMHYDQPGEVDPRIRRTVLWQEADASATHIVRWDPARVLAEVKAKRAILELHEEWQAKHRSGGYHQSGLILLALTTQLRLLAQPYAGRDGWQDGWSTSDD